MNTLALSHITLPALKPRHVAILAITGLLLVGMATAGTTGDEFKDLYTDAKAWAEGYLGKVIAMMAFLLEAGWSAAKQKMMPVIFGLILAIIISIGPALLEKVLSAVV